MVGNDAASGGSGSWSVEVILSPSSGLWLDPTREHLPARELVGTWVARILGETESVLCAGSDLAELGPIVARTCKGARTLCVPSNDVANALRHWLLPTISIEVEPSLASAIRLRKVVFPLCSHARVATALGAADAALEELATKLETYSSMCVV